MFLHMKMKGGLYTKRRSQIHVEGAIEFQHGDDIECWRKRRREGGMDTDEESNMDADA